MPAIMKAEKVQQYSLEIGNMIAEMFTRPQNGRFSAATMYEQVFREPDWRGMPETRNRPRRLAGRDSVYQHQVGPIYGPINPNLLPFSMEFIGYPALALLRQNIMLQNIVTVFSEEMTKKWVVPSPSDESVTEEEVQALIKLDQKHKGQALFRKALTEQLFSGGCLVFIDVGDENLEAPLELDPVSIPKGSLRGFRIVEPMNCYAMGYNAYDPLAENYFVPQYWNIQGRDVHASRFLYFAENELPILLRPAYMFFGIPFTQLLLDYVYNFERSRDAAARALRNHSLLGLMTDLSSILQTGVCAGNPQSIINRLRIMQATRDQDGIALLNKETEEFFQITTPLTGMQELTEQQLQLMSFAARIPVTKLFLTPPKGFSTTDEMSEQNWAQVINGRQTRQLTDNVIKFHKIIALNEWGKTLGTLDYKWPDVRDMSAKEKAELQNQLAQRDSTLVQGQILDASEVRERMAADEESGYSGIYIGDDWEPETPEPDGNEGQEPDQEEEGAGNEAEEKTEQTAPKPGDALSGTSPERKEWEALSTKTTSLSQEEQKRLQKLQIKLFGGSRTHNKRKGRDDGEEEIIEQELGEEEESGDALPDLEHPGGEAHSPERPAAQSLREGVEPAVAANAPLSPGTRRKSSQPRGNDPTRIRTAPDDV